MCLVPNTKLSMVASFSLILLSKSRVVATKHMVVTPLNFPRTEDNLTIMNMPTDLMNYLMAVTIKLARIGVINLLLVMVISMRSAIRTTTSRWKTRTSTINTNKCSHNNSNHSTAVSKSSLGKVVVVRLAITMAGRLSM